MVLYSSKRTVVKYNIDETAFIEFLKKKFPDDEETQSFSSIDDLKKFWGEHWYREFDLELADFIHSQNIPEIAMDIHRSLFDNYSDAYEEMEFGTH